MLKPRPFLLALLLGVLFSSHLSYAEDYGYGDDQAAAADDGGNDDQAAADDGYAAADDGGNDDGAAADDGAADDGDDVVANYSGDDYIKYWTEYAVLPKKCITYKNVDMIVFSMYAHSYNHCTDKPVGTYMTTVPTFVSAYVDQLDANAADIGSDDYEAPDQTFVSCYPYETNNGIYYAQLGCTDGDSKSLSVQLYKDNTCETPDRDANGNDDLNFDVSSLQIPFKECKSCVHFVDKNEDDVDDQYFENKMTNAPLCSTIWAYKQVCNGRCKRLGYDSENGWNSSDKVLLGVLSVFSAIMFAVILKKRTKMSNKDALLEEAALSAAGLQQTHIIGMFVLVLFVVVLFALLGLKGITWGMLLIINGFLFAYLMKLTIVSGLNAPDGQLMDDSDSDDDDDEEDEKEGSDALGNDKAQENKEGQYKAPVVSELPDIT